MTLTPVEGSAAYFETRDKIAATREHQLAAALDENRQLRTALKLAREKLIFYRSGHSGEYVGGMEYSSLMRQIEDLLNGKRPLNAKES